MNKYKLSICLPAFRVHLWEKYYNSVFSSINNNSWEMIMVGPNEPPEFFKDKTNFKFFKDYGNPTRCAQIATMLAEGELMMWGSDDGLFLPNSIEQCINLHDNLPQKDVIALRYTEGIGYSGTPMHQQYWMAHHHPQTRIVPNNYMLILVGMFKTQYFKEIGGWDCRFEALNMNCHDLAFRVQNDGGKIHLSPNYVSIHDWHPNDQEHKPIQHAYEQNDSQLFEKIYANNGYLKRQIKIDYFNWINAKPIWDRRFKT
jgi:hypothetical protein